MTLPEPVIQGESFRASIFGEIRGKPRAIELCAGTAGLSAKLRLAGFDVCAIDTKRNRFKVKHAITDLDISTDDAVEILLDTLLQDDGGVAYVHAGVPCGTASRAREIPIRGSGTAPRPLRTVLEPWGRTDIQMTEAERVRVQAANAVYTAVIRILKVAHSRGAIVSVENPENSLLWELPPYKELLELGLEDALFHQCAHGGHRPKKTRWRGTAGVFRALVKQCPGESKSHKHLPWGFVLGNGGRKQFATADEAAYPDDLCSVVTRCVSRELVRSGVDLALQPVNPEYSQASERQRQKAHGTGRSSMGKRPVPLVAEFGSVDYGLSQNVDPKRQRIIRELDRGEVVPESSTSTLPFPDVVVGTFRSAEEFCDLALKVKHPIDSNAGVPSRIEYNTQRIIEAGPIEIGRIRVTAVRSLVKLVSDLASEESALHSSWSVNRQHILKDKKMRTLEALAKQIQHPDMSVVDEACKGFKLVGSQPFSGYFQQQTVMAVSTPNAISSAAKVNNVTLVKSSKSSGDVDLDFEAWNLVQTEVEKGWLSRPCYSIRDVQTKWENAVISRRFPIRQGNKVRLIDDFNESNVNLAFSHSEKLAFHDIDVIAATISNIALATEKYKASTEWKGTFLMVGRTLDLKSAYKQFPVADDQVPYNIICCWDPVSSRPAIFEQYTLPFGAVAAVVNFNRIARLLWEILADKLVLIILNFYDDYPIIEPSATAPMATKAAELFLRLLGWQFAVDGAKSEPFAASFVALGVVFDISRLDEGLAVVMNKPTRIEALCQDIQNLTERGKLTKGARESLRGRLQFLERHVFGRLGKFLINELCGDPSLYHGNRDSIHQETAQKVLAWLTNIKPRELRPSGSKVPVVIFTDGAEGDVQGTTASCGALCIDPVSGFREFFGEPIPESLVQEWKQSGVTKVIAQAELLPVLLAIRVWENVIRNRRVLIFVDNESAKFACINMWSPITSSKRILECIAEWSVHNQSWMWFSRVASYSNPADPASRLKYDEMIERFKATKVSCQIPASLYDSKI